ncbi:MAG: GNAT family N-acetyltransferase [Hyphomicrobiales bacterium]|nr:GNAT family N-acetyltransferase [Hyphomicrobiales bacterium]MDE2018273.1 GNAT family N-acetyltransferase [Hyphomicrobiales bacterium]
MALFRLSRAFEPAPLVRGEGLYLRPPVGDDYDAWSTLRAASRDFLQPWEPTWPADDLTRGAFRRRVRRNSDDMARDEAIALLIFAEADGALLGGLTIGQIRRGVAQAATLGYWMGERHAGKGHMTRAVAAACRYAFETLRLHRMEAACLPENAASAALLAANGFGREGLARSYLQIDGRWRDHLTFAKLEGDR